MSVVAPWKSKGVFDFESVFKTDPGAPNGKLLYLINDSLGFTEPKNFSQIIDGVLSQRRPWTGELAISGSLTLPLDYRVMAWIMKLVMGAPTTFVGDDVTSFDGVVLATGEFGHTYELDAEASSFLYEKQIAIGASTYYQKYNGLKVSSWELSTTQTGEPQITINVTGAKVTLSASPYDAAVISESLTIYNQKQAAFYEGGAAYASCKQINTSITSDLIEDRYVDGTNEIGELYAGGKTSAEMALTLAYVATMHTTFLPALLADTESQTKVTYSGNGNNKFQIAMEEVLYEITGDVTLAMGQAGEIQATAKAFFDDGASASAVVVIMVNDMAAADLA